MTTTSPGTLVPATVLPTWRVAWADRENDRRRRAHHAELEMWRHRADELTRQRIEAATFLGCTEPRTGLPVELDPYELVFRIIPTAELIEVAARHVPGLPQPALSVGPHDPSGRTLPKGLRVADTGVAIVTSHRAAFAGRDVRREWWYEDLDAPAHHPDVPLTLLHPRRPGRLAGLRVPAVVVANTRFYLALALASARNERAAVIAELDALLATHHRNRPMPPVPVEPWQAPLTARRPGRRAVAAVAAAAFATLTAGAYGSRESAPQYRAEAGVRSDVDPPLGIGAVIPILAPVPGSPGGGAVAPTSPAPGGTSGGGPEGGDPTGPARSTGSGSTDRPTAGGAGGGSRPDTAPPAPAAATPTAPPSTAAPSSPAPAPSKPPSSSPPPPATSGPEPSGAPADEDNRLLTICLDPLRLPLLDPLLCPRDN
ncbi:hypothetical protein [Micromonospora avicenniae]|uniref:hypothetical protein n=1 Tax=Micromonospora avicenniae TaxID=1198245 RepID=UPI003327F5F2